MATCVRLSLLKNGTGYVRDTSGRNVTAVIVDSETEPITACHSVVLTAAEYQVYQAAVISASGDFDYAHASAVFAFFFSFTVGLWWVARSAGSVLDAVRRL